MVNLGEKAPEISVSEWLQGSPVKLADLQGKYVFLYLFQTNCPACFASSIPEAERLHEKYSSKGLEVIGIAVRFEEYDINTVDNTRAFLERGCVTEKVKNSLKFYKDFGIDLIDENDKYKVKVTHKIGWDEGSVGEDSKTFVNYGARGTPTEYIIDREGRLVARIYGSADQINFDKFFDENL